MPSTASPLTVKCGFTRIGRSGLSFLLCLGLSCPLAPLAAAQAAVGDATEDARRLIGELRSVIDPTEFDVDALALELAFEEPEDIAAWVAQNLRFEAYSGLLRGPQGTLVARAGNALDQAVLLARLLGDTGYEARVALGALSDQQALALVMSMFSEAPASGDERSGVAEAAASLSSATGVDRASIEAGLSSVVGTNLRDLPEFAEAVEKSEEMLAQLGSPNPADLDATPDLIAETKDYAWVEYRLTDADPWSAVHPAWMRDVAPPAVTATRYLDGEVPAELTHRVRIEMTIERKRGDVIETAPVMTPWESPVANLLGHTLVVGNSPIGTDGATSLSEIGADLADVAFYAPILDGHLAPGAMAFDLQGNLVAPEAAAEAMAGIFQTAGERVEGAAAAMSSLGGGGDAEPLALTAEWIDIVLIAPGGEETRHRRTIIDRRAATTDGRATAELLPVEALLDRILTTYSLMFTGGALANSFVADQLAEQALFHLDVIDALSALGSSGQVPDELGALVEELSDYAPKDQLLLFVASDSIEAELNGIAYRAEPAVIGLVGSLTPGEEFAARSGVDVVANAKRTLYRDRERVVRDFRGALLAGVWDTIVEREFVAASGGAVSNAMNGGGSGLSRVLAGADANGRLPDYVPSAAMSAIRAELANGYAVLVPSSGEHGAAARTTGPDSGFWRVDAATGETLGMSADGRGEAATEYEVGSVVAIMVGAALAVPSILVCATSDNKFTCYCDLVATAAVVGFAGAVAGALLAGEALVAYVFIDTAVIAPVTTLFSLPICSSLAAGVNQTIAGSKADAACWAA